MKRRLTGYTFDASEKTVTHASFSDVTLEGIQLITNVTDGIIIYQFNNPDLGGSLSTDTLTLDYDTTSMADADKLMILVEDGDEAVKTDDAAFTPGTSKVMMAGFEFDDSSPDSVDEGDAGAARMSSRRELYVQLRDAAGNERGVNINGSGQMNVSAAVTSISAGNNNIGDVDVASIVPGTGATNLGKAEDAGHTSADVGVMVLGVRDDAPDTARADTDNDYLPPALTSTGAMRIAPISEDFAALANGPQVKKYYTNSGAVTDGIIWSPASGKRWYVTDIIINTSAAATVTLEDDKAGGDEVVMKLELAANSGVSHNFTTPLFSGEDAADLLVTTSAGNIYISVCGYEI